MKPEAFVIVAERLCSSGASDPASLRSATSRAYYGAFLHVRDTLQLKWNESFPTGNDHQFAQRLLINCQVSECVEIGRMLSNLHESRKEADYNMDVEEAETTVNAEMCVERAKEIVQKMTEFANSGVGAKIKAGIRQYRRITNQ